MNNLKINVTLGSFKVELEGEAETVISQFEAIKKEGLGQIVNQLVPIATQERKQLSIPESVVEVKSDEITSSITFPSLKEITLKGLPNSESEWLTVYANFILNEGDETFTREFLIKKYKDSNRWSINNKKNLSNSIKNAVIKEWIRALNDNDYVLTDTGKEKVQEILQRTKGVIKIPKKKRLSIKKMEESNNE